MDYADWPILTLHITAPVAPEGWVDTGSPMGEGKRKLFAHGFDHGLVRSNGVVVGLVASADLLDSAQPWGWSPLAVN
jgi:hypothetical protein